MTPVADPNGWAGWEQTLSMPDSLLEAFRRSDELADGNSFCTNQQKKAAKGGGSSSGIDVLTKRGPQRQ